MNSSTPSQARIIGTASHSLAAGEDDTDGTYPPVVVAEMGEGKKPTTLHRNCLHVGKALYRDPGGNYYVRSAEGKVDALNTTDHVTALNHELLSSPAKH